jgi:hypothetical protein
MTRVLYSDWQQEVLQLDIRVEVLSSIPLGHVFLQR